MGSREHMKGFTLDGRDSSSTGTGEKRIGANTSRFINCIATNCEFPTQEAKKSSAEIERKRREAKECGRFEMAIVESGGPVN